MQIFICVDIRGEELHAKPMHTVRTQLARYIVRTLETMGRSKKSRPRRARGIPPVRIPAATGWALAAPEPGWCRCPVCEQLVRLCGPRHIQFLRK